MAKEILNVLIEVPSTVYLMAIVFGFCSFLSWRKGKSLEDLVCFGFWFSVFFFQFNSIFCEMVFRLGKIQLLLIFYSFGVTFLTAQLFFGFLYLGMRISQKRKFFLFWLPFAIFIVSGFVVLGTKAELNIFDVSNPWVFPGRPFLWAWTYFFFVFLILILSAFLVLKEWKEGKIGWGRLQPLYSFYAFLLYALLFTFRLLFLSGPFRFLMVFFFFLPYLIFLSYQKEKINSQ